MKITILYDNTAKGELEADWGFACLVEFEGRKILFDTGARGKILLKNMDKLNIFPQDVGEIFISHAHWDHTGGLEDFLRVNNDVPLYIPPSYSPPSHVREVKRLEEPKQLHENIYSTGELKGVEQSLAVKTEKGLVMVVGCSHPGVGNILEAASKFGKPSALIGGLHGFKEFNLLENLNLVCPTHCTQFTSEIKSKYPEKFVEGGAGKVIEI